MYVPVPPNALLTGIARTVSTVSPTTQGLRYLRPTAQLGVRVPPLTRAHSAAMGIWLTGSAWVLLWLHPPPYSLGPFGTVRMSSTQKPCYTGLQRTAHCVCTEKHSMGRGSACVHQRACTRGR